MVYRMYVMACISLLLGSSLFLLELNTLHALLKSCILLFVSLDLLVIMCQVIHAPTECGHGILDLPDEDLLRFTVTAHQIKFVLQSADVLLVL